MLVRKARVIEFEVRSLIEAIIKALKSLIVIIWIIIGQVFYVIPMFIQLFFIRGKMIRRVSPEKFEEIGPEEKYQVRIHSSWYL